MAVHLGPLHSLRYPNSKDKGNSKRVWYIRLYQLLNVDAWLQKENKTVFTFYQKNGPKYDDSIKHIFLILDNLSIHKSNKVKAVLSKYHPRIHLVFLLTRLPELNLIEVRWLWM